ncbi:MAG: DUF4405 domain-containing protein [Chlorobi bacterium]|nr:DUF4405 domain-containing protein [Chlorobiota bacterium]
MYFKAFYKLNKSIISSLFTIVLLLANLPGIAQSNDDCFMCHEDKTLTKVRNGKTISLFVDNKLYENSAHKNVECASCHTDAAQDIPHPENLKKVDCGKCHTEQNNEIQSDIHHNLDNRVGNKGPTCKICHGTHNIKTPLKIKNKQNYYCGKCHKEKVLTSFYHINKKVNNSCAECHKEEKCSKELQKSVHSKLSCANCHSYVINHLEDHKHKPQNIPIADCYLCHRTIALKHKESIHGLSISEGINEAANCWDCHGSHSVYYVHSDSSMVYPTHLATTCGKCHDNKKFNQKFNSAVKQPGKMYALSIHGILVAKGDTNAPTCVTCHGVHDIKNRIMQGSKIASINISKTCGKCHVNEKAKYEKSIHWIAVKKGVREAPTCNDCHSEHSMQAINTIDKREDLKKIQDETCLECHQNLLLNKRYGLESGNAHSYKDSYHGLAVERGDDDAAMCVDCHGVHDILPKYLKDSKVNENNVLNTCKKCHTNATEVFAKSYSHTNEENSQAGFIENIVRKIYLWLIIIVVGGMIIHNLIIFMHDLRKRYKLINKEIRVPRFTKNELIQHIILLVSFSVLAITGFQLKYPDSWWAEGLTYIGLNEFTRQTVHRISAVIMITLSFYHLIYLLITPRGRAILLSFLPKIIDFKHALDNILYNLHLKKKHPEFDYYDYTEKVEYWALIWGTMVMGLTGLILWFPTVVGDWAPVWTIKVAEIVHFYEAILATLAILVWHWFFVIFRPNEYPLSFTCVDGKMTITHYREEHRMKFKKIMVEYLELKSGKRTKKQISNLSKLFIVSVEKHGVDFNDFIKTETDKDPELKDFLTKKGLLKEN